MFRVAGLCIGALVAASGTDAAYAQLSRDAGSYELIPAPDPARGPRDYRISPLDTLSITVFQEPDLTIKEVQVDAGGTVILPLIGSVTASGKTSGELSREIADRLSDRFLQNPQVSVIVAESVSQTVAVEGSVTEPGVYEIKGQTTLLEALAMAKGPSRVAALSHVAVFRVIDDKRMGAIFDVSRIRKGLADDPEILGNDVVVVGLNSIKSIWRDVLTAAPLVAVFRPFDGR